MIWDIFVSGVYRACKENWINPDWEISWVADLNKIFAYVGNLPWVKALDNVNDVLGKSIFWCNLNIDGWRILHPGTIAWIIIHLYLINNVVERLNDSEEKIIIEKLEEKFRIFDKNLIF